MEVASGLRLISDLDDEHAPRPVGSCREDPARNAFAGLEHATLQRHATPSGLGLRFDRMLITSTKIEKPIAP
jgi:hypothetical protein